MRNGSLLKRLTVFDLTPSHIRFKSDIQMLRNLFLYTILISAREWPTRDFGTLIDHFGISAHAGMMKSELTVICISHVSERTNYQPTVKRRVKNHECFSTSVF